MCDEVDDSRWHRVAIRCVFNQVYDVCYSEHNKDNKHTHAAQPGAEDYAFLIGFLISVFIADSQFGVVVVVLAATCLLFVCVYLCESCEGHLC